MHSRRYQFASASYRGRVTRELDPLLVLVVRRRVGYPAPSNSRKRWGNEGYAIEELVAELGAAFLCADLELTFEVREDHAAYIASRIKALKDNTRAIIVAAANAQRAVDSLRAEQIGASIERAIQRRPPDAKLSS